MTDSKTPEWARDQAEDVHIMLVTTKDANIETISQALLSAYERGRKDGIEEAEKVVLDYPPDGFNAALYDRTERHDEHDPFWKFEGDTGNWAALMGEVLKTYATAIRQLLEVKG